MVDKQVDSDPCQSLLEILVCPRCKSDLLYNVTPPRYLCLNSQCGAIYNFIDEFPSFVFTNSIEIQKDTQNHYQETPFLWGQSGIKEKYLMHSGAGRFLKEYHDEIVVSKTSLDCGCGAGIISRYLHEQGLKVFSVDLSLTSLRLTISTGINTIHASNLSLPFRDGMFDIVISSGVVHHTPDAQKSVSELIRVLKSGGLLYLLIYRKESFQYIEYSTIGKILRTISKNNLGNNVIDKVIVPLFVPFIYAGKMIKFRTFKSSTLGEYRNYFYDRYITPQATFHSKNEVLQWFEQYGVKPVKYFIGNLGYHHNFIVRKL
ncbi:methyltransferase domain-containing protein [Candidatus Magnetominusculus xianensis]|uniref:methyltransferase domain-containing protein n=1 Tax=Candidatus Magnetominusculus xianensis TaxID=1748249 RepID=UPI0019EEDFC8|nr:methyltransferase domain-containing protein [Candidatus Magnetominusculus xianensis]MBF0403630.1 methyltransferase domain-containing protein [Nitrospirota bacterium]